MRKRSASRRIAQALGGLLLTLAVAELTLRLLDLPPPSLPRLPVDPQRVPLNRLGLRESWDLVPARVPGELRVVVLGDSFVFGEGVSAAETLPVRLGKHLAALLPDRRVRVFNVGFRGADVFQEAERYAALHEQLHPDILLLVLYLNDFTPETPARVLEEMYGARNSAGLLARHSWVVGHIWSRIRRAALADELVRHYRESTLAALPRTFPPVGRRILDLRFFVENDGVGFFLTLFPWLAQLDAYPLDAAHEHVRRFADRERVRFLDLLPTFRGAQGAALRVATADEHPNALAHDRAAAALARFLVAAEKR